MRIENHTMLQPILKVQPINNTKEHILNIPKMQRQSKPNDPSFLSMLIAEEKNLDKKYRQEHTGMTVDDLMTMLNAQIVFDPSIRNRKIHFTSNTTSDSIPANNITVTGDKLILTPSLLHIKTS